MNILLGNNSLSYWAGSETWTEAMALGLIGHGHRVICFAPVLGDIASRLERHGIQCFADPGKVTGSERPDVIIANHWPVVDRLRAAYGQTPIISTIHGIHHLNDDGSKDLEHPAVAAAVDQFVAVSEEVQDKLVGDYAISSAVVRNGLRLDQFRPTDARAFPRRFVVCSNYAVSGTREIEVLVEVAAHYGAAIAGIGQHFIPTLEPWTAIIRADVVIGTGRSVLEGMAMGRLGIVHGRWGTGGIIRGDTVDVLKRDNFSGRHSGGRYWDKARFIAEIDRSYTAATRAWGIEYVKENHDVRRTAEEYVEMARSLLS